MADIDNQGDQDVKVNSVDGQYSADVNSNNELAVEINNVATEPVFFVLRDKTTSTYQAAVDSAGRISTSTYSGDTDAISQFASVAVGVTLPTTILTYTVPTGKTLFITNWHLQANGGNALATINIDVVPKSEYYAPTVTGLQQYDFGSTSPLIALTGEVITIIAESGSSSNKTYYASFNGYETTN